MPTITVAQVGLNSILKLATELGIIAPFDGTMLNSVYLNLYETGLELGLNMVKGNCETVFIEQNPRSWASGMET